MKHFNKRILTVAILVLIGLIFGYLSAAFRPDESISIHKKLLNNNWTDNKTHPSLAPIVNYGYVLEVDATGQMTAGAMNILGLQCMTSILSSKILVVEPFVVNTTFGVVLSEDQKTFDALNNIKLSDVYVIDTWNVITNKRRYHKLVSWEDFIQKAPREVILLHFRETQGCDMAPFTSSYSGFLSSHGFRVVRAVCIKTNTLERKHFIEAVYGNCAIEATSVVITYLPPHVHSIFKPVSGGIYRDCMKESFEQEVVGKIALGKKIEADAKKYIDKYLGGGTNYVSIMIRLAKFLIYRQSGHTPSVRIAKVKQAFTDIYKKWNAVKKEFKIEYTFFTVDIGKYGSIDFIPGRWLRSSSTCKRDTRRI